VIPESALPGRHTKWAVQPVEKSTTNSVSVPSVAHIKTTAPHPDILSYRQPRIQDRQKTVTDDGFEKVETVWRHSPQLEKSAYETGQTVPVNIIHDSPASEVTDGDEYWDATSERSRYAPSDQPSTNADGEEELLFRDSDLAFDGRLPGLDDWNPAVTGTKKLEVTEEVGGEHKRVGSGESGKSGRSGAGPRWEEQEGVGEATKALKRRQAEVTRRMGMLSVEEQD
jgi:hypothetical protein